MDWTIHTSFRKLHIFLCASSILLKLVFVREYSTLWLWNKSPLTPYFSPFCRSFLCRVNPVAMKNRGKGGSSEKKNLLIGELVSTSLGLVKASQIYYLGLTAKKKVIAGKIVDTSVWKEKRFYSQTQSSGHDRFSLSCAGITYASLRVWDKCVRYFAVA